MAPVGAEQVVDQGDEPAVCGGQFLGGQRGQGRVELRVQDVAASQEFGFESAQGGPAGCGGLGGCPADVEALESAQQDGLDSGYGCFPP
ncbi:hypothetical protein MTF69_26655 [Streptomyces sp. AP-93]|nr:hypothetical protein [Streptomyces sp. AP-93]